ncbi:MAG: hypothetical protein V4710_09770 [Verrucomicrobiota bacterium]
MSFWLKIVLAVSAIWLIAGATIYWARVSRPTAQSVAAYVQSAELGARSGETRARTIKRLETMLNRLSFEDRQELQRRDVTREFVRQMTPEEQLAFLDATLPAGFKQMMDSFNRMEPARRRKILEKALDDMKKQEGERPPDALDEKATQRMVEQGMRSFYSDASADVKLDMAPLIEQIQRNFQNGR